MILGTFTYNPAADTYTGAILLLTVRTRIRITPNPEPCRDLPFDYWVEGVTPLGTFTCGRGWKRTWPSGVPFVLVEIHDPNLRHPLTGHLFIDRDGTARLLWAAPRKRWLEALRDWLG